MLFRSGEAPRGTETILVIDDEALLRNFMESLLKDHGYKVLIASDADEAFQVFSAHHHEIDLILSDVGLPKMSGDELFAKFKNVKANVKVILASGYMEPEIKAQMFEAGIKGFIQKPYYANSVLQKIREALDSSR